MFIDNNSITPLCFPTKPLDVLCASVIDSFSKFLPQLNISYIWDFIFLQLAWQESAFLSSYFLSLLGTILSNLLGTILSNLRVYGMLTFLISSSESFQDAAVPPLIWCYTQFLSNEINSLQQGSSYRCEQLPACLLGKMLFLCKDLTQYI